MRPDQFAELMSAELTANARKGDWSTWKPNVPDLLSELHHHYLKLRVCLEEGHDPALVTEFAADVGNLCMKAAEMYGTGKAQELSE